MAEMYRGYLYRWHCDVCDKRMLRRSTDPDPISFILPENVWNEYKKDPVNNMSPPIRYKD